MLRLRYDSAWMSLGLFKAIFEESAQGKVSDSVLVTPCQERGCTDDIFGMVVANLLQRAEFTVASSLFCHDITGLHINRSTWFGTYKIHLSGIQHPHLHLINKITQMLIDSILNNFSFSYAMELFAQTGEGQLKHDEYYWYYGNSVYIICSYWNAIRLFDGDLDGWEYRVKSPKKHTLLKIDWLDE